MSCSSPIYRQASAWVAALVVFSAACAPDDGTATTPAAGTTGPTTTEIPPPTTPSVTTLSEPRTAGCTPTISSPVTVETEEGESILEGEWYDSEGRKSLVIGRDTGEFFDGRGPFSIDTDVDPHQITLPFESGELTTIFRLDGGKLELVFFWDPSTPLPESIEEAAADPERYLVLEYFRGDVLFTSGLWTPSGFGLPAMFSVIDMTAVGDSLIVGSISGDRGLFVSTDNGASWRQGGEGFPAGEPVWAFASVGGCVFAGTQGQGVFVSEDGGVTWRESNEGLASPDAGCRGDPEAPHSQIGDIAGFASTVLVGNFCGVWRSDDLGGTWREINEGFIENAGVNFSLVVGDGFAYAGSPDGQGIFRLDMEEDVWERIDHPDVAPTAMVASEGVLFLSGNGGVWRSDDRGESWVYVGGSLGPLVADLAVVDDGTVLAATLRGVFWTGDQAETWVPYNADLVQEISALEISGGRLFAGGPSGVFSAPLPGQVSPPAPTIVIPVEAPEGYQVFDGSREGFALALPSEWVAIDLTEGDEESITTQLESIFDLETARSLSASYMPHRKTAASGLGGIVMVAFHPNGNPSVSITVSPATGRIEDMEQSIRDGVEGAGGSVLSADRLQILGGDGWRIVISFPEAGDTESHVYVIRSQDTEYLITFNTSNPEKDGEVFTTIIDTLKFADS